ncbi:MAG: hypothetical protein HOI50_06385 [Verrucomicrobia bacterium]|nr:hypothetical protein [Verrucomicrobiota bacterium]
MKKLAFFTTQFEGGSPAQHLVDRCLMGWPSEGRFIESPFEDIAVYGAPMNQTLKRRQDHPNLTIADTFEKAIADADAWILAAGANDDWTCSSQQLEAAIKQSSESTRGFVVGLPENLATDGLEQMILEQKTRIQASTPLGLTWRLPEVDTPSGAELEETVILIRGTFPSAEKEAVDALLTLTSHRKGGESGISNIERFRGNDVWKAAREGHFSWDLFSAAASRTNSKQGDATIDGRTQDIVGLGMVPKLAKDTRAWIFKHNDGLKSTIITVDGILNDDNFAARTKAGDTLSAQFYRPPKPNDHQFSRMMDRITSFLIDGENAFSEKRTLLWGNVIRALQEMELRDLATMQPAFANMAYDASKSCWKP